VYYCYITADAVVVMAAGNFRRKENYILMMLDVCSIRDYSTNLMSSAMDSSIDSTSAFPVHAHHPIMNPLMMMRYLQFDHTVSTALTIMPRQHPADVCTVIYPSSSLWGCLLTSDALVTAFLIIYLLSVSLCLLFILFLHRPQHELFYFHFQLCIQCVNEKMYFHDDECLWIRMKKRERMYG
jgi:hypothetical protein